MKRAQAATEFLTTYGWMFLIVVAVFGAMYYFGFGDIKDSLPSTCYFGTTMSCGATFAVENGTFAFEITNLENKEIFINGTVCGYPVTGERVYMNFTTTPPLVLYRGESAVIVCHTDALSEQIIVRGKEQFTATIIYERNETQAIPKIASGEIVVGVVDTGIPDIYMTTALVPTDELLLP